MMLRGFQKRLWTDSLRVEHSGISTDILLFSEVGLSLTQHYRVYKGGLPHAVFRTDYIERLGSLLRSSGQSGSPPETGRASTPKSVRRLHRSSQPKRLFSEAVDDGPFLIMQNPAVASINTAEWAESRHGIRGEGEYEFPTLRGDREVHHGYGH